MPDAAVTPDIQDTIELSVGVASGLLMCGFEFPGKP